MLARPVTVDDEPKAITMSIIVEDGSLMETAGVCVCVRV